MTCPVMPAAPSLATGVFLASDGAAGIDDLSSNASCAVAREKNPSRAQFRRLTASLQGRPFLVMFQHRHETADATRCQGVDWAGRNTIHSDFLRPEVVGKITSTGFEGGFGYAHDVVMRHDFLSAVVGHRDNASAIRH